MRARSLPLSPCGRGKKLASMRLAEGQIDALAAQQSMLAIGERRDTVKEQPRRPAPHHDIAVLEPVSLRLVGAHKSAEKEDCRQSERHRDDGVSEIAFVLVMMQGHPRAG